MKHKKATNQGIANSMSQDQSFKNYFSNYFMSKNNLVTVNKNYRKAPFIVEWQMENDKQDI